MYFKKTAALLLAAAMLVGCGAKETPEPTVTDEPEESSEPVPAEKTAAEKAAELLASMSTEDKAGQLVCMAVRTWNGENLYTMNQEVHDLFAKYHFGGICLFAENISAENELTVQLTQDFQAAAQENGGIPLLISVDQEGGLITRLTGGTRTPGNMAIAATGKPENAFKAADIMGSELNALGFNTDFAPDTDVNYNPANPVIGVRSFSDDPETVAEYVKEYAAGLENNNIIPTLKHFPGHGDTATDSHTGLPLIEKNSEEIMKTDLLPFKKLAEDGYDGMIMSAHIQFPNIELETYTSTLDGSEIALPSTLSRTFLTDILRGELGFEGPVITDAMNMDAIALHFNPQDAAALALNAGADMLLMPVAADGTESIANVDAYMSALVAMINDGTIPLTRVDEAVRRILTLKYENGIMDREYSEAQTEKMIAAVGSVGSEEHHEAEIALADEAVTVVENNGILPVAAEENMTILMVGMSASQANALGYAFNRLQESGQIPASAEGYVVDGNYSDNYGEANALLDSADLLIVTDSMYSSELIDFNANAIIPSLLEMIDTAHNNGTPVIAISCALPYDLPLLTSADALMAVYNQTGVVACDENFMPTAAYGPNIIGAMDVIFGKANPSGKLPVNIPVIENGTFTDGIAYERGTGLTW